jgi:hypothetical protein
MKHHDDEHEDGEFVDEHDDEIIEIFPVWHRMQCQCPYHGATIFYKVFIDILFLEKEKFF